MKTRIKNARDGYLLTAPLVLGVLIFYAVPFLLVIRHSLTRGVGSSKTFVGMENYENLLGNSIFRLAFGNTMLFLLVALPLGLVLGYAIALLLKKQVMTHSALKSVLLLPYIMPVVGTVLLAELIFAETGIFNQILSAVGLPVGDWLHSEYAFGIVVVLYLWKNTGYAVILLLSGLVTVPQEQYAVAELDGASSLQQFRYITTPQMWYSVFFTVVFSLINAFKCFREIFLIGGTHPDDSIYMLQHFINNSFENLNYPKLAVASVLLTAVLTLTFLVGYRWVMRKEAARE